MSNPLKRPRTEGSAIQEDLKKDLVKDKEAWFYDGNIDIVAEGIAFRVHRSVLSLHSDLFRDMLSIPQAQDAGTSSDVPAVDVTDSADDMRHLLLTLYHNNKHFKPDKKVDFEVVNTLVHIAHKYQVQNVLDEAMSRIKALFPGTMHALIKVLDEYPAGHTMKYEDTKTNSLRVIEIARLVGDTSLLRPAYYRLCQHVRRGGPEVDESLKDSDPLSAAFDEVTRRAVAGAPHLRLATLEVREEAFMTSTAEECFQDDCLEVLSSMNACMVDEQSLLCDAFDCVDMEGWSDTLCGRCVSLVQGRENDAQERVWEQLPTFFNFKED
ncbi:uncharacterized protein B0H18DRAFT_52707 [Fomitopsis serialis]|uniref:uncharacterized protein n=1 Tax=Fomitopsis serialis TaxID=139415 RepID=UPI0020078069|nr:uncharacterized protein B0H18DRAFT_52707 [Neoantrodia serialis]KAH9932290.1 hypothetical protein B0H18DRAFT_52707 [Neoantrodia serialis]